MEQMIEMQQNASSIRDILIFTPVLRLEPETVHALMNLEWDGALSILLQMDNPGENGPENHFHQYQRGRETFLAGRWDALLTIESDIIPPADTLLRLTELQVDVAYGVYRFRASNVVNVFERYPPPARNTGESLSVKPWLLAKAVQDGETPCSGAGLGCVLIRRKVIERIPFRITGEPGVHCDTPFNNDVYQAGFSQMAAMSVICGHKNERGEILWPELPITD